MLRNFVVPALLLAAAPAAAITVTSAPGAPDPGPAPGQTLVVDFDNAAASGITQTQVGAVVIAAGDIGGVRAAPAGTGNGVYASVGGGGSLTFDFSGFTGGKPLSSLSFYWGSVDGYNFVDFLDSTGVRVGGIGGNDLPIANGDQVAAMTNRRVMFDFLPSEKITGVRLRSDGAAFEFDSLAVAGAVPEPASWALLIIGFAAVGAQLRSRRGRLATA